VTLGTTPLTSLILEQEFPALQKLELPPYAISYSSLLPVWMKLLMNWRRISSLMRQEHQLLGEFAKKYDIDTVISDSRYGLHNEALHSVLITHQLFVRSPVMPGTTQRVNKRFLANFNEVWVPDYEDESRSLGGELSHGELFHARINFIGPQSRLQPALGSTEHSDYLFLLSGPEPQRSLFEKKIIARCKHLKGKKILVRGTKTPEPFVDDLSIYDCPTAEKLASLISGADTVVCRSGYSTLMDLHLFNKKKLVLVPTKGQTEQEYLADYWQRKFNARKVEENNFEKIDF
jgi:UDP-N-acetylglucosamine transferase subunit ALG13